MDVNQERNRRKTSTKLRVIFSSLSFLKDVNIFRQKWAWQVIFKLKRRKLGLIQHMFWYNIQNIFRRNSFTLVRNSSAAFAFHSRLLIADLQLSSHQWYSLQLLLTVSNSFESCLKRHHSALLVGMK
jgi:hypothetical protein